MRRKGEARGPSQCFGEARAGDLNGSRNMARARVPHEIVCSWGLGTLLVNLIAPFLPPAGRHFHITACTLCRWISSPRFPLLKHPLACPAAPDAIPTMPHACTLTL